MTVFTGDLWLAAEPASRFPATVDLSEDNVTITAGAASIGEWNRQEVTVTSEPDGFHLSVGGDVLVFRPDSLEFGNAVGVESSLTSRMREMAAAVPAPAPTRPMPQLPEIVVASSPSASNGMAVTAMVLGIVGVLLGLIPIFGLFALGAGILAIVFGILARGKVKRGERARGKGMAWSGVLLGVLALALGIAGLAILNNAIDDFSSDLEDLSETFETFGQLGEFVDLELEQCTSEGASGTLVNNHTLALDIAIDVFFYDAQGTQVDTSFAFVNGVRPGGRAVWDAAIFGTEFDRCRAEVSSAFES